MKRVLLAIGVLSLAGCTMGPNYKRPAIALPTEFRGAAPAGATPAASLADTKWQDLFNDPVLNQMVSNALAHNFDLQAAAVRVEEARAQLGITRANQYPFVNVDGSYTAARGSTVGATPIPKGTDTTVAYAQLGAALSWELDLWGRLRRQTEASRARYLATEEAHRDIGVSLVANVMESYFQLLEQDLELTISHQTQGVAKNGLSLTELRRDRGAASGLDVRQAEQLLYIATSQGAAAERNIAQSENLLSLLQGSVPAGQSRGRKLEEIALPTQMPAGLPADLLQRRPDIREAEQNLIAANAEIGAARALYFPQISLGAFFGSQSRLLSNLFTGPAAVYSIAPGVTQKVFRAGQTRNQVR